MSRGRKTKRDRFRLARSNWTRAAAGLLLWAGGAATSDAWAQGPMPTKAPVPAASTAAPAPGGARYHLNKRTVQLPIQLDDRFRPQLQEIHLYYKERAGAGWTLREKVPATQTAFTFQAPRDGEYFFTMVTMDRQGRCVPADVSKEEPALTVVVDTQPPEADVALLGSAPEGQLIQLDVRDIHPDANKTRVQFQTADKVFRDLAPLPDQPNVYCVPAQANATGEMRAFAADMAGNRVTREFNVTKLVAPSQAATAPSVTPAPKAAAVQTLDKAIVPVQAVVEAGPAKGTAAVTPPAAEKAGAPGALPNGLGASLGLGAPPTMPTVGTDVPASGQPSATVPQGPPIEQVVTKKPAATASSATTPAAAAPVTSDSGVQPVANVTPPTPAVTPHGADVKAPAASSVPQTMPTMPKAPTAGPATIAAKREGVALHRQLVNSPRLFLEYSIEKTGASGVGRVEVWCTRDKGQSWNKLCEDHDRRSPAEVLLPGDGVYGLTLVVSNGLGFGAQPPLPGDAPGWWVEVDTTRPVAQIATVRLVTEDVPVVHIGWTSQDRNLPSGPVELSYAVSRQGPWVSIAKHLKAEGQYRWVPPMDIGRQAFIRLTAHDSAGNTTVTETTQPVALDDLTRPRARIAGITTDAVPPAAAPK